MVSLTSASARSRDQRPPACWTPLWGLGQAGGWPAEPFSGLPSVTSTSALLGPGRNPARTHHRPLGSIPELASRPLFWHPQSSPTGVHQGHVFGSPDSRNMTFGDIQEDQVAFCAGPQPCAGLIFTATRFKNYPNTLSGCLPGPQSFHWVPLHPSLKLGHSWPEQSIPSRFSLRWLIKL